MNELSVGNRVKIIRNIAGEENDNMKSYDRFIGKEGVITKISSNNADYNHVVLQVFGEPDTHWDIDEVELIVEKSVADQIARHIGVESKKNEKITYLGGDLLKKGSIMLRDAEAKELRSVGVKLYSPIEDKSINDKSNISKEDNGKLAERIVKNDTKAIIESDYIIIEPQDDAKGTMVELGQIKGMKDASRMVKELLDKFGKIGMTSNSDLYKELEKLQSKLDKKVYPHYEDIRRTDIEECGDRRSLGINQYVYGVCLDLTDGKGFYEWGDIVEEMKEEYKLDWHDKYVKLVNDALKKSKDIIIGNKNRAIIPIPSHVIIGFQDLYIKSGAENLDGFYKELYRINSYETFEGVRFEDYAFVSQHYKEGLRMELDYKRKKNNAVEL